MPRTITLRLDEDAYRFFHAFALADRRTISNLIETSALRHLEECLFVDEAEMESVRSDRKLVRRLKRGSADAKARRGRFVE